ncbi:RDD family protein [Gammaproteobacteria bacterium]|nr:RDD family protein [Gammaproteobacteria bacterium]
MESSTQQAPINVAEDVDSNNILLAYAGFWIRVMAAVLDSLLLLMVMVPLLMVFYRPGVLFATESPGLAYDLINYVLPLIAVMVFWQYRSATPGKIMMGLVIVDAKTLGKPSFGKLVLRYIGYYVSTIPLLLGLIWVGIDKRKQGWHDKIAGTLVLKTDAKQQAQAGLESNNVGSTAAGGVSTEQPENTATAPEKHDPWKE